jgi:hypothetical protein
MGESTSNLTFFNLSIPHSSPKLNLDRFDYHTDEVRET